MSTTDIRPPKSSVMPPPWPFSQSALHIISSASERAMPAFLASKSALSCASVTLRSGVVSITSRNPHIRCQSCSCFLRNQDMMDSKAWTSNCPLGSASHVLEMLSTSFMQMSIRKKLRKRAVKSEGFTKPPFSCACLKKFVAMTSLWFSPSFISKACRPNSRKLAWSSALRGSSTILLKNPAYISALVTWSGSTTLAPWRNTLNVLKAISKSNKQGLGSFGRKSSSSKAGGS
mmetsp:Transcript_63229/g.168869  ORF Transcript_63229/g.168869 Transcript_63229/m.168869 type:complete len:232 (-) Transcript_63229:171-866(-)